MPPEDDDSSDVVRDKPSESSSEVGVADIARTGQEKPQEQKDKEQSHEEMRRLGKTPSSKDLPQLDWSYTDDGTVIIKMPDKVLTRKLAAEDIVMSKELASAKTAEPPPETTDKQTPKADASGKPPETTDKQTPKADASEKPPSKDGGEVKSEADKLLDKFKNFTPEEREQLKKDLADIDKLPPEQSKKVYESLDRIARNDEHPEEKMRLTGQQARELVSALAHQVAHPETLDSTGQALVSKRPEVYADMVSKLATDGQYTTADGHVVKAQGFDSNQFVTAMKEGAVVKNLEGTAADKGGDAGKFKETELPNHHKVREYPDHSRSELDEKGRVVSSTNKEGKSRTFRYNEKDEIDEIKGMNGAHWHKTGEHTWVSDEKQPHGKPPKTWKGDLSADADGNIHYKPLEKDGRPGRPYELTREGKFEKEPVKAEAKAGAAETLERTAAKVAEGATGSAERTAAKTPEKAPEKGPDKAPEKTPEKPADPEAVKKALKDFDDGQHWYKADEFDKMNKVLADAKPEELNAIKDQFKKDHNGQSVEDYLRDRWKDHPDELKKALDTLQSAKRPVDDASVKQGAKEIDGALHWYKSDDYKTVVSALENRSPEERHAINEQFKKDHDGKGIAEVLQDRWKEHPEELKKVQDLLPPEAKQGDAKGAAKPDAAKETGDAKGAAKPDAAKETGDAKGAAKPEAAKDTGADKPADKFKETELPNHHKVREYPDHSRSELDEKGRVVSSVNKEGKSRTFHYNEKNEIDEIKGMNGATWHKTGEHTWVSDEKQPHGKPPKTWKGDLSADADGNIHYKPLEKDGRPGRPYELTREGKFEKEPVKAEAKAGAAGTLERTAAKVAEGATGSAERTAAKTPEKTPEKAPEKGPDKAPEKTPEKPADPEAVKKALKDFDDGQHWYKADEFDKMNKVLADAKPEELNAIKDQFKKDHNGQSVEDYLRDRWKDHPDELKKALDTLQSAKSPEKPEKKPEAAKDTGDAKSAAKPEAAKPEAAKDTGGDKSPQPKPDAATDVGAANVRQDKVEEAYKTIHKELVEDTFTNDQKVTDALKNLTPEEKDALKKLWAEKNKDKGENEKTLDAALKDEYWGAKEDAMLALAQGKSAKETAEATHPEGKHDDKIEAGKDGSAKREASPDAGTANVRQDKVDEAYKTLHKELVEDTFTNDSKVTDALKNLTPEEKDALKKLWAEKNKDKGENEKTLDAALKDEYWGSKEDTMLALAKGKADAGTDTGGDKSAQPKAEADKPKVDQEKVDKAAKDIDGAMHWYKGDDHDLVNNALAGKNKDEIEAMKAAFQKEHPDTTLEKYLTDRWGKDHPDWLKEALDRLHASEANTGKGAGDGGAKPEAAAAKVDQNKVDKLAESLHKESGAESWAGKSMSHTDREKVFNLLKDANDDERKALLDTYQKKYGHSLEEEYKFLDGSDKDKFDMLLHRKADDPVEFNANKILAALKEEHETFGKSKELCEKDIRDTLSTMNSKQIEEMLQKHPELKDKIMKDDKVSQATKDACEIYLKGNDKRDVLPDGKPDPEFKDTMKLADLALKNKDVKAFEEAMRNASPEARKYFMEHDGEKRLKDAFEGHWYNAMPYLNPFIPATAGSGSDVNVTDKELRQAMDFAKEGKLSTAEKIKENSGVVSNNDKAIEQALANMTDEERKAFVHGKELAAKGGDESKLSEQDKKDLKTYKDIHQAIIDSAPADLLKLKKWEDMAEHKDGSLVAKVLAHHGYLYNDGAGDMSKDIENIPKEEWQRLHNLKEGKNADGSEPKTEEEKKHNQDQYQKEHDDLKKALESLKEIRGTQSEVDQIMKQFDAKMDAKTYDDSKNVGERPLLDKLGDDTHWYKNDRKAMVEDITHMTKEEQDKYRNDPEYRAKVDQMLKDKLGDCPAYDAAQHLLKKIYDPAHPEAPQGKPEADIVSKMALRAQENKETKDGTAIAVSVGANLLMPGVGGIVASGVIADRTMNDGGALTSQTDAMFGSHSANAVRDIEEEFRKSEENHEKPTLRERLQHPETEADKKLAADFEKSARQAMGDKDYDKYGKELLEKGRISAEERMALNQGALSNDKEGSFKDMEALAKDKSPAAQAEKEKILNDKAYQDKVLGYLSEDDRKVALIALKQGKMEPEDKIQAKLNHVGGSDDIKAILSDPSLTEKDFDRMRSEYAKKYGGDLDSALREKLGGDFDQFQSKFRKHGSATEAYQDAHDQFDKSTDGAGRKLLDGVGAGGTGAVLDDAMNQYSKEIAEAHRQFKELPPEKQKEIEKKFADALENFKESKSAAADYTVDAAIAVVAIASMIATGGVDAPLVIGLAIAGAAMKVGGKALIEGGDYDSSGKAIALDALTGALSAVANVLGPGEIAAIFKVGETAAIDAAELTIKELGEQGVKTLLKDGGKTVLEDGAKDIMRNALAHGAKDIDEAAIRKLAETAVSEKLTGEAREQAVKQLTEQLEKNLKNGFEKETESWLKNMIREGALNAGAGGAGGALSSGAEAGARWDGSKSFAENMKMIGEAVAMGAASGAAGALVMTGVMKVGGKAWEAIAQEFKVKPGDPLPPQAIKKMEEDLGHGAKVTQKPDGSLEITEHAPPRDKSPGVRAEDPAHGPGDHAPDRPPDTVRTTDPVGRLEPGEDVHIAGKDQKVLAKGSMDDPRIPGAKADEVVIRPADAPHPDGPGKPVNTEELKSYHRVGESNFYEKDGTVFELREDGTGGRVLVEDPHAEVYVHAENITLPKSVLEHPDFDWANIPPEARVDMVRRAQRSEAFQQEAVRDFVQKFSQSSPEMGNHAELLNKADNDFRNLVEARKKLDADPANSELKKTYDEALKVHQATQKELETVSKKVEQSLQKALDEFADAHGLPRTKVELADLPSQGHGNDLFQPGRVNGQYGDGKITLNRNDVLGNHDLAKLIDTAYHEFTHAEQDSLVIRYLVHDNEFKLPLTPQQKNGIIADYELRTGRHLSEQHLDEVLQAAENRAHLNPPKSPELNATDIARAQELLDPKNRFQIPGELRASIQDDINAAVNARRELAIGGTDRAQQFVDQLAHDDGSLSKKLFGTEKPPAEIQALIEARKNGTLDPNEAASKLDQQFKLRADAKEAEMKDLFKKYILSPEEQEAWITGTRAGIEARERGLSNSPVSVESRRDLRLGGEADRRTLPGLGDPQVPGDRVPGSADAPRDTIPSPPPSDRGPDTARGLGPSDKGPDTLRGLPPDPGGDRPVAPLRSEGPPLRAEGPPHDAAPAGVDAKQRALMDGRVEGEPRRMTGGLSNQPPEEVRIRTADGEVKTVVFHPEDAGSQQRLAKELAAYRMDKELGFDSFPVTGPETVEINGRKGWIQEHSGERLDVFLKNNGADTPAGMRKFLEENPELKKQIENAWMERMILGDQEEIRPGNFVISQEGGKFKVKIVDVEYAFGHNADMLTPEMDVVAQRGIFANVAHELSGQPINPEALKNLQDFVKRYENPAELQKLIDSGMSPLEAKKVLAHPLAEKMGITDDQAMRALERARYLAENGHFPTAKGYQAADPNFKALVKEQAEAPKHGADTPAKKPSSDVPSDSGGKPGQPVSPDRPDAAQVGIRDADIDLAKARELETGGSQHRAFEVEVRQADGTTKKVIFHADEAGESLERMRNDKAAYKLNQMMGLDNGFPATIERDVKLPAPNEIQGAAAAAEFDPAMKKFLQADGKLSDEGLRHLEQQFGIEKGSLSYEGNQLVHNTHGWAQESVGQDFRSGLEQLAKERYGDTSPEAIQRLMKEDPEVKQAIETAMVERALLGDVDFRDSNFRMVRGADGKIKVENIDMDFAFKTNRVPEVTMPGEVGVTRQLAEALSDKPLSPELREKMAKFVEKFDNPAGRAELAKTGLNPDQVDAYLARAKHMADTGKFPHVEPSEVHGSPTAHDRPTILPPPPNDRPTIPGPPDVHDRPTVPPPDVQDRPTIPGPPDVHDRPTVPPPDVQDRPTIPGPPDVHDRPTVPPPDVQDRPTIPGPPDVHDRPTVPPPDVQDRPTIPGPPDVHDRPTVPPPDVQDRPTIPGPPDVHDRPTVPVPGEEDAEPIPLVRRKGVQPEDNEPIPLVRRAEDNEPIPLVRGPEDNEPIPLVQRKGAQPEDNEPIPLVQRKGAQPEDNEPIPLVQRKGAQPEDNEPIPLVQRKGAQPEDNEPIPLVQRKGAQPEDNEPIPLVKRKGVPDGDRVTGEFTPPDELLREARGEKDRVTGEFTPPDQLLKDAGGNPSTSPLDQPLTPAEIEKLLGGIRENPENPLATPLTTAEIEKLLEGIRENPENPLATPLTTAEIEKLLEGIRENPENPLATPLTTAEIEKLLEGIGEQPTRSAMRPELDPDILAKGFEPLTPTELEKALARLADQPNGPGRMRPEIDPAILKALFAAPTEEERDVWRKALEKELKR